MGNRPDPSSASKVKPCLEVRTRCKPPICRKKKWGFPKGKQRLPGSVAKHQRKQSSPVPGNVSQFTKKKGGRQEATDGRIGNRATPDPIRMSAPTVTSGPERPSSTGRSAPPGKKRPDRDADEAIPGGKKKATPQRKPRNVPEPDSSACEAEEEAPKIQANESLGDFFVKTSEVYDGPYRKVAPGERVSTVKPLLPSSAPHQAKILTRPSNFSIIKIPTRTGYVKGAGRTRKEISGSWQLVNSVAPPPAS